LRACAFCNGTGRINATGGPTCYACKGSGWTYSI
jgi:DnaJ-class molecular chaperone